MSFEDVVEAICARGSKFAPDAYHFVNDALGFTLKKLSKRGVPKSAQARHVTGQELLHGIRCYALEQFGPMTRFMLEAWGVQKCEDFGCIVFALVEEGVFGKTDGDSLEDFGGGYDFEEAFVKPFKPQRPDTAILSLARPRKNLKGSTKRPAGKATSKQHEA